MRKIRAAISALIILSCFVSVTQQVVSQNTTLTQFPDLNTATLYVQNLIDDYNSFVIEHDKGRPDFNVTKTYFPLYHEAGYSFKVLVVQTTASQADWLTLIFISTHADQPNVAIDYNDTLASFFPYMVITLGNLYTQPNLPFKYHGAMVYPNLILDIYAGEMQNDYMTNAYNAALFLYEQDHKQVPTVSQTQTVNETLTQITTIESVSQNRSWVDIIWNNLADFSMIVGLVASLLYLYKEGRIPYLPKPKHKQPQESKQRTKRHNKQE